MANRFIKDPNEVLKVHQQVEVTVTEVDVNRKRISLSMKTDEPKKVEQRPAKIHQPQKPAYNPPPKKKEPEVETDMAVKLAALKNLFK